MINNISVLIADDELGIRNAMFGLLSTQFSTVYLAKDGEEVLKIYNDKKPDILILDNLMPKITGLELIKKIRQKDLQTKIILITAYNDEKYLLDAIPLSLSQYIVKPINSLDFFKLLDNIVEELQNKNKVYLSDDYIWDKSSHILTKYNYIIKLTQNEIKLLDILSAQPHNIINADIILDYIWSEKILQNPTNSIRNLINKLHKKLTCEIIKSIYGQGYELIQK